MLFTAFRDSDDSFSDGVSRDDRRRENTADQKFMPVQRNASENFSAEIDDYKLHHGNGRHDDEKSAVLCDIREKIDPFRTCAHGDSDAHENEHGEKLGQMYAFSAAENTDHAR